MENIPKISVLMPAYNAEKYIAKAIESILNQTFRDFEFIIINDCSTDKTLSIIEGYAKKDSRIRIINTSKNLYISRTLNMGIENAKADIIARMDADDISLPKRLEKQYELLNKNEKVAIIGSYIEIINEDGKSMGIRKYPVTNEKLKRSMFRYSPFAHPAVMYRKKAIQELGCYIPVFSPLEDVNLWFRVGTKYDFATVPEVLFKYRFFENSSSNKKLHEVEIKTLKIRWHAFRKQGYRPNLFDIIYNIGQASTIYLMPRKLRIRAYNFIRKYI